MEYLAFANQLQLPHWLMIAGTVLVLFGAIGILVRRPTDGDSTVYRELNRELASQAKDRLALPAPRSGTQG